MQVRNKKTNVQNKISFHCYTTHKQEHDSYARLYRINPYLNKEHYYPKEYLKFNDTRFRYERSPYYPLKPSCQELAIESNSP
jgi:hypothetical protein